MPVPAWSYGKSVPLENLKAVTDSYVKSLEPKRKLQLAPLPSQVKDSIAAFTKALKQDKASSEVRVQQTPISHSQLSNVAPFDLSLVWHTRTSAKQSPMVIAV